VKLWVRVWCLDFLTHSVVVITLDFSEAFDTVRHSTLIHKMAFMNIPDDVNSWLVGIFSLVIVTVQGSAVPRVDSLTSQPA